MVCVHRGILDALDIYFIVFNQKEKNIFFKGGLTKKAHRYRVTN